MTFRLTALATLITIIVISCKKETSCEGCNSSNLPPVAIAGDNQVISSPVNTILLNGTASYDPDGKIIAWRWTKISGPNCQLNHADSAITYAVQLMQGTYQFELQVTDDKGANSKDTIQLFVNTVSGINQPPIAVAGADLSITFPQDSISLDGSASTDVDGYMAQWQWTKIAGPSTYDIQYFDSPKAILRSLSPGNYQFELKVTDDKGAISKDTIEVIVKDNYSNTIRVDSLYAVTYCTMQIPNLNNRIPFGSKFDVYLRYYWGTNGYGYSGPFFKLDTIPDAQTLNQSMSAYWYWYEYNNGLLTIHYPHNIDCNFDPSFHDVMIKWN